MQLGTVIGHATSTIKHLSFNGWRLVLVQPLNARREPEADGVVAVDKFNAGAGQREAKPLLWWCDGPCGAAKAALVAQAKESALSPMDVANDGKQVVKAIKHLAAEVKAGRAGGGVLLVQTGATALLFANRCPSLR